MGGGSHHVLIVDDDDSIRSLLADALRDDGFTVDTAGTTRAALDAVTQRKPDVILLDMRMPDDGPGFQKELATRSLNPPIIAMSASIDGSVWATAISARYVKKPFTLEELFATVRSVLAERV